MLRPRFERPSVLGLVLFFGALVSCTKGSLSRNETAAGPSSTPLILPAPVQQPVSSPTAVPAPVDVLNPGVTLPSGCEAKLDACLPEDSMTWELDCDGDGVPGYAVISCLDTTVRRLTEGAADCNDENADWFVLVTEDADGDGYGADTGGTCTHPDLIPEGYASRTPEPDCNDDDASIHPSAEDVWGDQLDMDCNGQDTPSCDTLAQSDLVMAAALLLTVDAGDGAPPDAGTLDAGGPDAAVPVESATDAGAGDAAVDAGASCRGDVELFVSEFVVCWDCTASMGMAYAFVGNGGTARFDEPLEIHWTQRWGDGIETGRFVIAEGLDPSEGRVYGFDLSLGVVELTVQWPDDAERDCDPGNELSFASPGRCI